MIKDHVHIISFPHYKLCCGNIINITYICFAVVFISFSFQAKYIQLCLIWWLTSLSRTFTLPSNDRNNEIFTCWRQLGLLHSEIGQPPNLPLFAPRCLCPDFLQVAENKVSSLYSTIFSWNVLKCLRNSIGWKLPVVAILSQCWLHFVQNLVQQLYLLILLPGH